MSEFEQEKDAIEKKSEVSLEDTQEDEEEYVSAMLHTTQGEISKIESDVFGLLQSLVTTLCSIVLLFTFVCPITKVSGSSMEPTLQEDEVMLVWAVLGYEPEISDIVIVTDPTFVDNLAGQSIVKRVIALEGQTVEMDYGNNQVLVDGSPIFEPYLGEKMVDIYGQIDDGVFVVPEDCVFVLGDNRNHSSDSRDPKIGMVHVDYIKGKVIMGVWPIGSWRTF